MWIPEGLNNTYALRQFIQWCVSGTLSDDSYWYDEDDDKGAHKWTPSHEQERYRALFREASGFVITVGWRRCGRIARPGGVFWRGVPKSKYDAERYELRMKRSHGKKLPGHRPSRNMRLYGLGPPTWLSSVRHSSTCRYRFGRTNQSGLQPAPHPGAV
jgi:hypothetical protein